jgi:hypothetical protein
MARYWNPCLLLACLPLAGCTSDPSAPINQAFPIRQMDAFFGSPHAQPALPAPTDYTQEPGYLPAYPPYSP